MPDNDDDDNNHLGFADSVATQIFSGGQRGGGGAGGGGGYSGYVPFIAILVMISKKKELARSQLEVT